MQNDNSVLQQGEMTLTTQSDPGHLTSSVRRIGCGQTMRVFVLSKYAIVRSALRHMLSSSKDIDIVGESDASEMILDTLNEQHPDVVLLETVDASDLQVSQALETISQTGVRLVVLAAQGDPNAVRAMMKAGVMGYVLKQSTDTELLIALRSAALGRKFLDSTLIDALASTDVAAASSSRSQFLSKRQTEVLRYFVQGYTSGEIASRLGISIKTVETYRSRIYEKTGVHSRAGLMQYAAATGLISMHADAGRELSGTSKRNQRR
jgi:DNA-binding NarL/FixJ family response regulator